MDQVNPPSVDLYRSKPQAISTLPLLFATVIFAREVRFEPSLTAFGKVAHPSPSFCVFQTVEFETV